jgi:antitoxin ParD1/3/4
MRTNIDIDDATLDAAMRAGAFKTKKDAVEAGLKLLARQAAYREILKWEGKLHWDGDDAIDAPPAPAGAAVWPVQEPRAKPDATAESKPSASRPRAPVKKASHGRR